MPSLQLPPLMQCFTCRNCTASLRQCNISLKCLDRPQQVLCVLLLAARQNFVTDVTPLKKYAWLRVL